MRLSHPSFTRLGALQTLLFLTLLQLGNCACGCKPCGDLSAPTSITIELRDGQGRRVPVERARLIQGDRTTHCNDGSCHPTFDGLATLRVESAGEVLEREVELLRVESGPTCESAPTQTVELSLAGQGCELAEADAIQGVLRDVEGVALHDAHVEVELYDESAWCVVSDSTFRCPALTPYTASYRVHVKVGSTRLEQTVSVAAEGCSVTPAAAELRVGRAQCYVQPAIHVELPGHDESVSARVRVGDLEQPCATTIVFDGRRKITNISCPAITKSGGGAYELFVRAGGRTHQQTVQVWDDGCSPQTVDVDLDVSRHQ